MATGKLPKGVQVVNPVATMASRSKQRKRQEFQLENLPHVVLDKILAYLSPEDLRRFYQVSKAWQNTLVSRKRVNSLRVDLVEKIRLNKENRAGGNLLESVTPHTKETTEARSHDGKPGSRKLLGPVTNSTSSIRSASKPRNLSTPSRSRVMLEYEAGKHLLKGQVLFRCPDCRSPVPSPVSTSYRSIGLRQLSTHTPKKLSSSSPSLIYDSGFDSIEVSTDSHQVSFADHSEQGDTSTEEIAMSFIATPEPGDRRWNSVESSLATPDDESFANGNNDNNKEPQSTQCPNCSHRFCCKCQCTAHPENNLSL
ncbi:unnamed protein product [Allacma fusca]|uniref:F-box domain-containing protein n=1 Tax=Allacma fusca TaxID=39272 RepID=A0A8J2P9W1_9HEXA|nr:unnamed protein product [Allacma fusca]